MYIHTYIKGWPYFDLCNIACMPGSLFCSLYPCTSNLRMYTYSQMSDIACASGSLSADCTKAASASSSSQPHSVPSSLKDAMRAPVNQITAAAVNSYHTLTNGGSKFSETNNGIAPSHDFSRQNADVTMTDGTPTSTTKSEQSRSVSGTDAVGAATIDISHTNGGGTGSVQPEKGIRAPQQQQQGPESNLSSLPTVSFCS